MRSDLNTVEISLNFQNTNLQPNIELNYDCDICRYIFICYQLNYLNKILFDIVKLFDRPIVKLLNRPLSIIVKVSFGVKTEKSQEFRA